MEEKKVKIEQVSVDDAEKSTVADAATDTRIPELEAALADMNDKYLRAMAELENTRRRGAIDAESRARVRAISVAEKILPVADAVDAALKHTPDDAGIKSLALALESAFEQIGIVKMETVGKLLDPTRHNAIQVVNAPDGVAPNTITEELQAGYMMGDTILRTAMVVVAK
ncbi:MAG: nucleotide exchange factor GrpE [Alphaproteobacteria bacterium]|nr:nucleotide exchange factor GrpE [Alphaproteobacteria bacterium]